MTTISNFCSLLPRLALTITAQTKLFSAICLGGLLFVTPVKATTIDLGTDGSNVQNWFANTDTGHGTPFPWFGGITITSNDQASGAGISGFNAATWDGFWNASEQFVVPVNMLATLAITSFSGDDRAALFLDGKLIDSSSLAGVGNGILNSGSGDMPFFFPNPQNVTLQISPGAHTLFVVVNNTDSPNINAPTRGFNGASDQTNWTSQIALQETAQTPELATLFLSGFGLCLFSHGLKRASYLKH